ncbi:MAG: metalloregulator ArsR/SmtB family transcription factor [Polyangiales bacterium]
MLSTFEVVAEPSRRRILDLLRLEERSVNELVTLLAMSQPAVSKHLRVLKDARLVESEVDAQRRRYRLRPEPLRELDAWLAPYRTAWAQRLDALGRHLDRMDDVPPRGRKVSTERSARAVRRRK